MWNTGRHTSDRCFAHYTTSRVVVQLPAKVSKQEIRRPGRGKVTESAAYGRHAGLPRKAGSSGRRGFLLFSPNPEQARRPASPKRRLEKGRCDFLGIECAKLSYSYAQRPRRAQGGAHPPHLVAVQLDFPDP